MSNHQKLHKFQQQLLTKYRDFTASPEKALATVNCAGQWAVDQHFAITKLHINLVGSVAVSLFTGFTYRWEKYYLEKPVVMETQKQKDYWEKLNPNRWLRKRIKMIKRGAQTFPVSITRLKSDGLRTLESQVQASRCVSLARECVNDGLTVSDVVEEVQAIADLWGFKPIIPAQIVDQLDDENDADYDFRKKEDEAWFRLERLLDEKWWNGRIEVAYRQFCEHCQIIGGRVHKGASEYLSKAGRADYKERQEASAIALSQVVAVNEETGEEVPAIDIIKKSIANPAIRRCELMVRIAGFELVAQELGLIGGFFTMTAPSRFHAFNATKSKNKAYDNVKYKGANPKQTQQYLSKVWAQARAKLKRMNIHLFGFRVCEPHHDGTPHWHAMFFFRPNQEQAIRFVLADYFTKEDRDELHVTRDDFKAWALSIKKGFTTADMFVPEKKTERKHIFSVGKRIKSRFDYKRIDPKKGSATGYIAKYIAKNIDGYQMDADQDTGTPADIKALAVRGWASTWCIRQFQQIGGAPVSVWRELRRMPQTDNEVVEMKAKAEAKAKGEKFISQRKIESFYDLQKQHNSIEVARIGANSGNWSMYIHAMGGAFCSRKDHPIKMTYKDSTSKYGETVKKLEGITNGLDSAVTRSGSWVFTHKLARNEGVETGATRPWSSDNNCTVSIDVNEKQEVSDLLIEKGEKVDDRIISELFTFTDTVIEDKWVGDIKRTIFGRLKRNVMNIGGNFRLNVWEENVKRTNVTYIDLPPKRFKNDSIGKKNNFFDIKPLSDEWIEIRDARQSELHPMTWNDFSENVAKNGKYVAPPKDNTAYMKSAFKKGHITEQSLNGYLALGEMYQGNYYHGAYLAFIAGQVEQSVFHDLMDSVAHFSDGAVGESDGMFTDFVKGLVPDSLDYEKAVETWSEMYE
jgi:hypothetical protein